MLEKKDRRAVIWTGIALLGAASLGRAAFAGNYNAVVPSNAGIEYFSVEMTTGQYLSTTVNGAQLLVDDITYGMQIIPGPANIPTVAPLWHPADLQATYEAGGTYAGPLTSGNSLYSTVYGSPLASGTLPSGRTITYDVETWSVARYEYFACEMQEQTSGFAVVRAFDVTTQFVHAAMFARLEHVSGGGRGDALGLGTSEAIGTLSESRHYQTPHIIQPGNQVACVFTGTGTAYNLIQVYVKGRVIVDSGDALVDASFTSPADVTVH